MTGVNCTWNTSDCSPNASFYFKENSTTSTDVKYLVNDVVVGSKSDPWPTRTIKWFNAPTEYSRLLDGANEIYLDRWCNWRRPTKHASKDNARHHLFLFTRRVTNPVCRGDSLVIFRSCLAEGEKKKNFISVAFVNRIRPTIQVDKKGAHLTCASSRVSKPNDPTVSTLVCTIAGHYGIRGGRKGVADLQKSSRLRWWWA